MKGRDRDEHPFCHYRHKLDHREISPVGTGDGRIYSGCRILPYGREGQGFAAKYADPKVYTDLEAMVQDDEIDAVYIASPNSYHVDQAILCMNHGKHVLCEKPMASNAAEVAAMIEAAKNNDVLLMEALKSTLMPNFKTVRDNLYKLGPIRRYFASYCQYSSRYDAFKQGRC